MTLPQAINHYYHLRAKTSDVNRQFACTKILICLENARTATEAIGYLVNEVDNATSSVRRDLYRVAIATVTQG